MDRKLINSYGSRVTWKRFQKFGSLEVCKQLWQLRGLKRRLPWNFTCADFIKNLVPSKAFTMAEILISLTIIGIIAAITLPALQANINESAWKAQRKALYSRMSQAISMMPSLNGYGVVFNEDGSMNEAETANNAAQTFVSDGLGKVLKINNICDGSTAEGLKKCGFPDRFIKMGTNSKIDTPSTIVDLNEYFSTSNNYVDYSQINTNVAAFETVNGESVLTFYNPNCSYTYGLNAKNNSQSLMQPTMCANFIYDLNGKKGPNQVGKDIGFMTAFYPTDSEIAAPYPMGYYRESNNDEIITVSSGNAACRNKYDQDAKMANIEELKSIFTNNKLGYVFRTAPYFISSSVYKSSTIIGQTTYSLAGQTGGIGIVANPRYIFCVKR